MFDATEKEQCEGAWLFLEDYGYVEPIHDALERAKFRPSPEARKRRLTIKGWETYARLEREYRHRAMHVCEKHGRGVGPCCHLAKEGDHIDRSPLRLGYGDLAYHLRNVWAQVDILHEGAVLHNLQADDSPFSEYTIRGLSELLRLVERIRESAARENGQSQEDSARRKRLI